MFFPLFDDRGEIEVIRVSPSTGFGIDVEADFDFGIRFKGDGPEIDLMGARIEAFMLGTDIHLMELFARFVIEFGFEDLPFGSASIIIGT